MISHLIAFFFGFGFQDKESGFYIEKTLRPNRFRYQFQGE